MTEYKVYFRKEYEETLTVEADSIEAAIKEASKEGIGGICFQCSGYGRKWTRDDSSDLKLHSVFNTDNKVLWLAPGVQADD